MKLKRVGCSNNRTTYGAKYKLVGDGYIIDDNEDKLYPSMNSNYWEFVDAKSSFSFHPELEVSLIIDGFAVNLSDLDNGDKWTPGFMNQLMIAAGRFHNETRRFLVKHSSEDL